MSSGAQYRKAITAWQEEMQRDRYTLVSRRAAAANEIEALRHEAQSLKEVAAKQRL